MPSSDRLVAVAAHGLAGSRTDLPVTPLTDLEWFDLVQACLAADLVGFLVSAAAAGDLPTTPGQADELVALRAEGEGLTQVVERRAATLSSLLTAAAVDHRIVDGPARRLAYRDASVRHARSVRVLVSPPRLEDALALLGPVPRAADGQPVERRERLAVLPAVPGLGALPSLGGDSSTADAATGAANTGAAATGAAADVFGAVATVVLDDRAVPVLTVEQQLIVACVELCSAPVTSLVDVRDVAELALSPGLRGLSTRRLADGLDVTAALAEGVALAWNAFDLADKTELSVWARRMGGRRPVPSAARPSAPAPRVGLAQRVFGRVQQPVAAPGAAAPAAPAARATASLSTGHARPAGPTRR
jgi:hypothetical protein